MLRREIAEVHQQHATPLPPEMTGASASRLSRVLGFGSPEAAHTPAPV
jgi:hypothetical protein